MTKTARASREARPPQGGTVPWREALLAENRSALEDPRRFWEARAQSLHWFERHAAPFHPTEKPPYGKWFPNWTTNLAYNCLDRWVDSGHRHRVAYYWEGERGESRILSYETLWRETGRLASALTRSGIRKGDRITLYLPMIPELPIAMLAAVRIGAIHSVVFGGFASQALADRLNDSGSRLLITADGGWRRGKLVELKRIADSALEQAPGVESVVVIARSGHAVPLTPGRDATYAEFLAGVSGVQKAIPVEATEPSFMLYTSGTTGKPKGALHSTGGYMVWALETMQRVFSPQERDLFWCTADIGWITGHTYIVYGPLLSGISSLIYEGAPDYPKPDRWWSLVEHYRVNILYTSPTAIRGFIRQGEKWLAPHDLSSLRLLGSVGEPINPEVWRWYSQYVGGGRCPIVDTWWQTETGGILISPQPGAYPVPLKPGSATFPLPGIDADVVDESGHSLPPKEKGFLIIRRPWPGEFIGLWGDDARFRDVYFTRFPGAYYPGDFCLKDEEGYFWLLGRADEVMKVSGHRLSTTEIEGALLTHPAVAESAVIGRSDAFKGETPVACVILKTGVAPGPTLRRELQDWVRERIGPFAVPSEVYLVEKVPKTRSAKIMRRLIRDVVEERPLGDMTTLEDETSIDEARRAYAEFKTELERDRG